MDPLCISPSWVEHCNRLLPGLAWVPFLPEDNQADEDDDFVLVTSTNLKRLLQLPYAICVSIMAFHPDFARFADSFLQNRERMSANQSLTNIDIAVFSLFYRFAADVPPGLKFSSGAKTGILSDLQVLSPIRILQLVSLFHNPQSTLDQGVKDDAPSPVADLVRRWVLTNPQFERDLGRTMEAWSLSKSARIVRHAAGLRGLQELLPLKIRRKIFPSLAGVRGSIHEAIRFVEGWYFGSSNIAERGHLLVCLAYGLVSLDETQMEELFKLVMGEVEELAATERLMLKDVLENVRWFTQRFTNSCTENLGMDSTRVDYVISMLQSYPSSDAPGDPNSEEKSIVYIKQIDASGASTSEVDQEYSSDPVFQLKEIAPHLGRHFCERLLEACNWDVNRAIASVMEGTLPEQVMHLDFSAETSPEPVSSSVASNSKSMYRDDRTADDLLKDRLDLQVKAQITSMYDEYDDEYDDALDDGGGRLAVDTGAQNLDEDDPNDDYADDAEENDEGPLNNRGEHTVPPFAMRAASSPSKHRESTRQKRTQPESQLQPRQTVGTSGAPKRSGGSSSSTIASAKKPLPGPRDMIAPVSREASIVDVDGVRRNAQGQEVEEDELMRPNTNRAVAPPSDTDRRKLRGGSQQPRVLTPEEEALRTKRERERKEARGNVVRQRGADRKQGKAGF